MALEKRPRAQVRDIATARSNKGGRPAGHGYDPATGEEVEGVDRDSRGAKVEFDVFALVDSNEYRPDRFYTRSIDKKGHGESLRIRVPQGIDSQLYAAVAEIGHYNSVQDLFRDATIHRLEWLQRHFVLSDGIRRMLELERFQADRDARAKEIETMTESVADIEVKLDQCYRARDWQLFAQEMSEAAECAEWLREPYKGRAVEIINSWKSVGAEEQAKMHKDREDR